MYTKTISVNTNWLDAMKACAFLAPIKACRKLYGQEAKREEARRTYGEGL